MSLVANRYAEALLELARDEKQVLDYRRQLDTIAKALDDAGAHAFFLNRKISKEEKKKLVATCFKDRLPKNILNFLYVLIDKGRMVNYREISSEFHRLCNRELNIKEGVIESVRPLKEEKIRELEKLLSNDQQQVELLPKINRTLISGFRISFDDEIIDNSMKKKINSMELMLKRKDGDTWN